VNTKRALLLLIFLVLVSFPAFAILGLGDIVFDPSNYQQAISQLLQLEQEYQQLVKTYETVRGQYDQMVFMAKRIPVDMRTRYQSLVAPWQYTSATNTYGTTAPWVSALNSGVGVPEAYRSISEPLAAYGSALSKIPGEQLERLKRQYGTIEVTDGAIVEGAGTIGAIRRNSTANESAISRLEEDSLSPDPNMNSEIGVLNKMNAAEVVALRSGQDTNKLLVALTEQQLLQAKRERDAEARGVNEHVRFVTEEEQVLNAQGTTDAIRAWRMP
jgi:hypothetical protein